MPTMGEGSLDASFGFYLRSIPNPDSHGKDTIQESLGTDMLQELTNSNMSHRTDNRSCGGWLVSTVL